MLRCLNWNVDGWLPKDYFLGPMALLVAALMRDQKRFNPDEPRLIHLIEDIMQHDIESLSIKLDIVRLEQLLENEKGLHPVQRFPFAKKEDKEEKVGPNPKRRLIRQFNRVKRRLMRNMYPRM
ncbi:hypothetical protein Hanom_Chr13g01197141 [Helianthus anomalus]